MAETKEDRQRDRDRKHAAEAYDEFDKRVEKHWTEKAREEMTERDWRIFREDFSIAYKGNTGSTLPIRNWEEAGLPQPLMEVHALAPVTACHLSDIGKASFRRSSFACRDLLLCAGQKKFLLFCLLRMRSINLKVASRILSFGGIGCSGCVEIQAYEYGRWWLNGWVCTHRPSRR